MARRLAAIAIARSVRAGRGPVNGSRVSGRTLYPPPDGGLDASSDDAHGDGQGDGGDGDMRTDNTD
jgi:hypothetical protein